MPASRHQRDRAQSYNLYGKGTDAAEQKCQVINNILYPLRSLNPLNRAPLKLGNCVRITRPKYRQLKLSIESHLNPDRGKCDDGVAPVVLYGCPLILWPYGESDNHRTTGAAPSSYLLRETLAIEHEQRRVSFCHTHSIDQELTKTFIIMFPVACDPKQTSRPNTVDPDPDPPFIRVSLRTNIVLLLLNDRPPDYANDPAPFFGGFWPHEN